jgi:murein DD-endopeptidase MepM/ murein hydrolase activator NlpD
MKVRFSTRRWAGLLLAAVMVIPAVVSVAMAFISSAVAKQYRAYAQSSLRLPGALQPNRLEDHARPTGRTEAQPGQILAREASFHAQASTAHVVSSPLHNLAALPVGHHGSLLPAVATRQRVSAPALVLGHPVTKPVALTAEQPAVPRYGNGREGRLDALAAEQAQAAERAQAAGLARLRDRQEDALEALAAANHRQQVARYLQALAAARHREDVERFLGAVAANRARWASVRVSRGSVPPTPVTATRVTVPAAPPPPVAGSAFHAGIVTPPARSTTPAPVTSVPGKGGLPLPAQYLQNGTVDQGVDYAAPGGTPLLAMGSGKIVRAGIAGFGPNAPVLQIAQGPLAGRSVYYGHAGPNVVPVGANVAQGQQISIVGYGRVGISTGPHLEVGFYPPGPNGSGQAMLTYINSVAGHNTGR